MSDESPDDPLARLRAEADQAREQIKELARNLSVFYAEALATGFEQSEAFTLTSELMEHLLRLGGDDD